MKTGSHDDALVNFLTGSGGQTLETGGSESGTIMERTTDSETPSGESGTFEGDEMKAARAQQATNAQPAMECWLLCQRPPLHWVLLL